MMSIKQPAPFFKRRFVRAHMGTHAYLMRRVDDSAGPISVEQSVECLGPLLVENLSAGGALLLGGAGFRIGQFVQVELPLQRRVVVCVRAVVVRIESHRTPGGVALQFVDVPRVIEDAIQHAVWAALRHKRRGGRKVVVVTPRADDERLLGPQIISLGVEPVFVSTLLEALRWLQDPRTLVSALVIDAGAEGGQGLDALAWCEDAFPYVRRVLIADESSQDHGRAARRHVIHAIIRREIALPRLARALAERAPRHTLLDAQGTPRFASLPPAVYRSRSASTIPVPAP